MNKFSSPRAVAGSSFVDDELALPLEGVSSVEINHYDDKEVSPKTTGLDGVTIGTFVDHDEAGRLLVDFVANPSKEPLVASTMVKLNRSQRGREVALMFPQGDPQRPLCIGLIQDPSIEFSISEATNSPGTVSAAVDNDRVVLKADKEIVLQCGKASITLTQAGKVLVRGAYVLSRSSGVNRIKGASVQIN